MTHAEFLEFLEVLEWQREQEALLEVASALSEGENAVRIAREGLSRDDPSRFTASDLASHETTTHWKWYLGSTRAGAVVWVHQYKDAAERRTGYADSVHNHRYSFVSAVLRGGYTDTHYTESAPGRVQEISKRRIVAPTAHVVDASEIHSIDGLIDGTFTLITQAPKRSGYSVQYFRDGAAPRRHYDMESMRPAIAL